MNQPTKQPSTDSITNLIQLDFARFNYSLNKMRPILVNNVATQSEQLKEPFYMLDVCPVKYHAEKYNRT